MYKFAVITILVLICPSLVFADLPFGRFSSEAFSEKNIKKWSPVKKIITLRWGQEYLLMSEHSERSKLLMKFSWDANKKSSWAADRKNMPFYVEEIVWIDNPVPVSIKIPVLEVSGEWVKIFTDWTLNTTGWIKADVIDVEKLEASNKLKKERVKAKIEKGLMITDVDTSFPMEVVYYVTTLRQTALHPMPSTPTLLLPIASGEKQLIFDKIGPGMVKVISQDSEMIDVNYKQKRYKIERTQDVNIVRWIESNPD